MKQNKYIFSILITLFLGIQGLVNAQEAKKLYDPTLDGMKQINEAIGKASKSGKHVLIQYGGNWCKWCIRFDAFCKADTAINRTIETNYLPVKLNYDPSNKNEAANAYLGNPMRFGFPVLIIVDGKGKVLHIQDSGLLEDGQGYSKEKVQTFFSQWTPAAIVPKTSKRSQTK